MNNFWLYCNRRPWLASLTLLMLCALLVVIGTALPAKAGERPPMLIGGVSSPTPFPTDACPAQAKVVGLDPYGDNFLSVRSGPGGRPYDEKDRIHTGQILNVCSWGGTWIKVVYAPGVFDLSQVRDCGVSTPWPVARPYVGPCRWGWVHKNYIEIVAG